MFWTIKIRWKNCIELIKKMNFFGRSHIREGNIYVWTDSLPMVFSGGKQLQLLFLMILVVIVL